MRFDLSDHTVAKTGLLGKLLLGVSALALSFSVANAAANCTTEASPNITIAVASNMWLPAQALVVGFNNSTYAGGTEYVIQVCHGSTGSLVAEINAGNSNYSLFLAANATAPDEINDNLTYGSAFNYTIGIPALWTLNASLVQFSSPNVTNGYINTSALVVGVNNVVIADPSVAPYGLAAQNIMTNVTGQWEEIDDGGYLVETDNINTAYTTIANNTNNVGYVAYSEICSNGTVTSGYAYSAYPVEYHIPQAGIIINDGNTTDVAIAQRFVNYLNDTSNRTYPEAQYILQTEYCYGAPTNSTTVSY